MGSPFWLEPLDARAQALSMCGIAGVLGLGSVDGLAAVRRMTGSIRHRGPDDSGDFAIDGVAFGMRRLSIIDVGLGHQPIWTPRGTGIVFNGEIYNYRELRTFLQQREIELSTQSDTEVIAHLFDLEGLECVHRLEGMFAICLYEPGTQRLHLIRDRLGKKPLYYGDIDGILFFASETKAILAGAETRPELSDQAIYDFLTLRYVPGPSTMWRNIRAVESGTCVTIGIADRTIASRRYWSLAFQSETSDDNRDYAAEFELHFQRAVEKRLVASDVPVGILLSGGLDSSAVAATAVELGHQDLHTFSVAFNDGEESDETPFARLVAQRFGMKHSEIVIGQEDFIKTLPQFVRMSDEPLADLASIPLYFVSRLASNDVKVVLSGEGADETLAGYDMERLARQIDRLRTISRLPSFLLQWLATIAPAHWARILKSVEHGGWSGIFAEMGVHMTRVFSDDEKIALWRGPTGLRSTDTLIRGWYQECRSPHPLDQLQQVYCRSWLIDDLLMKADKMSMAASLEVRCPFLDHMLVEWCARLPVEWKAGSRQDGYVSKRILRQYAAKRLPAEIIDRPKRGFPVPAYRWLEGNLMAWARERLQSGGPVNAWIDVQMLEPMLDAAARGSLSAQHQVWNLLVLEHWLEAWTA
jgi:asparagine synthase (glutamine-hydrolysing)